MTYTSLKLHYKIIFCGHILSAGIKFSHSIKYYIIIIYLLTEKIHLKNNVNTIYKICRIKNIDRRNYTKSSLFHKYNKTNIPYLIL